MAMVVALLVLVAGSVLFHLLTLTYVPHYFDILPMYMVVLAMVPAVMALAGLGPAVPLAASITLYLAQLALGWDLPAEWWSDRPWFFDPFAWQLLFGFGDAKVDNEKLLL